MNYDEKILGQVFSWFRSISGGKLTQAQVDAANKVIETNGIETFITIIGFTPEYAKPREPKQVTGRFDISDNAIELIKALEGFRNTAYLDTGGVWTIGYGTIKYPDGKPVKKGDTCTKEEAETYLRNDLQWVEKALDKMVTSTKITQNQFDALASFLYNIGESQFSTSTLLSLVNKNNFQAASSQFERWVYDNGKRIAGLLNRRAKEKALFTA